jgi:hypothetical protein
LASTLHFTPGICSNNTGEDVNSAAVSGIIRALPGAHTKCGLTRLPSSDESRGRYPSLELTNRLTDQMLHV